MRKFTFLSLLLAFATFSFAQTQRVITKNILTNYKQGTIPVNHSKAAPLWTDDFSTPANWAFSTGAGAATTDNWVIGTAGPSGSYAIAAIASTSAANGFALFDSDLLCSGNQIANLTNVNPINLSGHTVCVLQFEEFYRRYYDSTFVFVSTDNATWTKFQIPANVTMADDSPTANPQLASVNISSAIAANPSTVYIRFQFWSTQAMGTAGGCGYAWMIDDIQIIEPPVLDVAMKEITTSALVAQGNATVSGTLTNNGSTTINSIDVNYTVNGGSVQTQAITGLNIGIFSDYSFDHNISWLADNAGSFSTIKLWLSNPNGVADPINTNDTLSKNIFVNLGINGNKKVLLEEFTTINCGYCPEGHWLLENMLSTRPNLIGVCHHAGFGTDGMTITEHSTYATAFANGAPTAAIDRHRFSGTEPDPIAIGRGEWEAGVDAMALYKTPCDIKLTGTYNSGTRALAVSAQTDFVDYALPGTIRMTMFLVEDSVSGTAANMTQHSYYYNDATSHFYHVGVYSATNQYATIANYQHRQVVRKVLPSAWGTASVISSNPAPGNSFSIPYTATLPATWNANRISLVAFVSYYDTDASKRSIINAFKVKLSDLPLASSIENQITFENKNVIIYPNPARNEMNIANAENAKIQIFNVLGEMLVNTTGTQNIKTIDVSHLANGTYFVKVTSNENTITQKIILNK